MIQKHEPNRRGPSGPLRRSWPSDEVVVEMAKLTPAPRDEESSSLHVPRIPVPEGMEAREFVVLMDLCCLYARKEHLTDEHWDTHTEEINALQKKGLLMEPWEVSPHDETPVVTVVQMIPTLYCMLVCVSLVEPVQWYLDPFDPPPKFENQEDT